MTPIRAMPHKSPRTTPPLPASIRTQTRMENTQQPRRAGNLPIFSSAELTPKKKQKWPDDGRHKESNMEPIQKRDRKSSSWELNRQRDIAARWAPYLRAVGVDTGDWQPWEVFTLAELVWR